MMTLQEARELCGGDDSPTTTGIILARTMEAQEIHEAKLAHVYHLQSADNLFPALRLTPAAALDVLRADADHAQVLVDYLLHHLKTRDAEAGALLGRASWPVMEARMEIMHEGRRFPWRVPMRDFKAPASVPEDQREAFEDAVRQEEAQTVYSGAPNVEVWDDLDAWFRVLGTYYAIPEVCHASALWRKALLFVTMAHSWDRLVVGAMLRHVCKVEYLGDNRTIGFYQSNRLAPAMSARTSSRDCLGVWHKTFQHRESASAEQMTLYQLKNLIQSINQNYVPR